MTAETAETPEDDWIKKRRKDLNAGRGPFEKGLLPQVGRAQIDVTAPHCGLALSGGGIRSATFSLGFLQGLSARGIIPQIDYLSTVSGGSYIGAFLGALYVPDALRGMPKNTGEGVDPEFDCRNPLGSAKGVEGIKRLRESGRYLSPAGTSDVFYGSAIVLRNWVAMQLVIGLFALLVFGILQFLNDPGEWLAQRLWPGAQFPVGVSAPLVIALVVLSSLALASGAAYWCTRRDEISASVVLRIATSPPVWGLIAIMVYAGSFPTAGLAGLQAVMSAIFTPERQWWNLLAWTALCALVLYIVFEFSYGRAGKPAPGDQKSDTGGQTAGSSRAGAKDAPKDEPLKDDPQYFQQLSLAEDEVRSKLSRFMSWMIQGALWCIFLLVIVYLGFEASRFVGEIDVSKLDLPGWQVLLKVSPAALPPLLSYVVNAMLKRTASASDTKKSAGQKKIGWIDSHLPMLILIGAILLLAAWLTLWSSLADFIFNHPGDKDDQEFKFNDHAFGILCSLILVNIGIAISYSFINLSSLSTFYAARLRRAYIGASSRTRTFGDASKDNAQDTIAMPNYYKGMRNSLGPIHLINVTIAETSGASNLVARDRKGKPMILSPGGFTFQDERPGEFRACRYADGEQLPIANWVAISGAAVSTAIGSSTSLGTSILATLTNVRLGYWWKQQINRSWRAEVRRNFADTVHNYLFKELRGAFDGTLNARWYLTDGGHFDNTGIYALLQRKVQLIIACDNGADPQYQMEDMVRLIGRARTDLGVTIAFLSDEDIKKRLAGWPGLVGTIGEFGQLACLASKKEPGGPIAAVAELSYRDTGKKGVLLLVKPRLTFTEPPELIAYHKQTDGTEFPQQTTADQFFDEAQWEAYRQLGELAATKLFPPPPAGSTLAAIRSLLE